jgi:hypothetical protein
MKEIAANGGGINSVAREFGWPADFVKRVRDAHGIDIVEGDGLAEPRPKSRPEYVNLTLTLPKTLHARIAQEAAMLGLSPQRLAQSVVACAYAAADDPWMAGKKHALANNPIPAPDKSRPHSSKRQPESNSVPVASASHPEQKHETQ